MPYTIPKPAAGTSRAASPTETEIIAEIADAIDDIDTRINAKAPLASPALTGTPTAPTAPAGTDTTQVATTAFVGAALPPSASIDALTTPPSSGGWTNLILDGGQVGGGFRFGADTVGNTATWPLALRPGTYTFSLLHRQDANRGIYTVTVDGVVAGTTIDGYAASAGDTIDTITGIAVPGGDVDVTFTMSAKNPSSSAFYGAVVRFGLTRTGP